MGKTWVSPVGRLGGVIVATIVPMICGAGAAWADDRPLLVVVEAPPGLGVDAAAVRQRIAGELGRVVIAPRDAAAAEVTDLLVVALDAGQVQLSLREGSVTRVARTIPDLADRAARLRAIAWLAGNLARDQVSAMLPLRAPQPSVTPAPEAAVADPAPERAVVTQPPPLVPVVSPTTSEPTILEGEAQGTGSDRQWVVTAAGGLTATQACLRYGCPRNTTNYENLYTLELQRQIRPDRLAIGGALDAGPTQHLLGLLGFVGSRWQRRRWYLEATVGAGVLAARIQSATSTVTNSSTTGTRSETTVSTQVQPALYARAVGAIGVPISTDLDLVAGLAIHLTSTGATTNLLSATAGVRLKLP